MIVQENRFRKMIYLGFLVFYLCGSLIAYSYWNIVDCDDINTPQASSVFDGYISREWNTSFPNPSMGGSIWGDEDNLYTISTEGQYIGTWKYVQLSKWNKRGQVIWQKEWGDSLEDKGVGIWGDQNYIYTCGTSMSAWSPTENASSTFLLIKWNKEGDIIWSKTWNSGMFDYFHQVWGDENYIYLLGSSTNMTLFHPNDAHSNVTLWKLDFEGNIIWNQTWEWNFLDYDVYYSSSDGIVIESIFGLEMCIDDDNIFIVHSEGFNLRKFNKDGDLVWNNTYGIINETGYFYGNIAICEETNFVYISSYDEITKLEKTGNFVWNITLPYFWNTTSTLEYHQLWKISTNGEYLFTTGRAYFEDSEFNWWDGLSFHKWDTDGNLLGYDTWHPHRVGLGMWGDAIWVDENDIYITSQIWHGLRHLIKFNLRAPYFLYYGVPPIGIVAIGTVVWFWIKPVERYKRKKLATQLETIASNIYKSGNQDGLKKLDDILNSVETFGDSELLKKWELLHKKCNIDMYFMNHLDNQKEIIQQGDIEGAYEDLIKILNEANSEAYAEFVDKSIVSDIADLLKLISNKVIK